MRGLVLLAALVALSLGRVSLAAEQRAYTDARCRLEAIALDGHMFPVTSELRIHRAGWTDVEVLSEARGIQVAREPGKETWSGRIGFAAEEQQAQGQPRRRGERRETGPGFDLEQVITNTPDATRIALKITNQTDQPHEDIVFGLSVPTGRFARGRAELTLAGAAAGGAELPAQMLEGDPHIAAAQADGARLIAPGGRPVLTIALSAPRSVTVQDTRKWQSDGFEVYVTLAGRDLAQGQSAEVELTVRLDDEVDRAPLSVALDAAQPAGKFIGFGGNYCFSLDTPVAMETLRRLNVAHGRIEMKLADWEPENDNASAEQTDLAVMEARDTEGSEIRQSMLIGQELAKRGVPFSISIWRLPQWMTESRGKHRIQEHEWPEVLEGIGSYLLYAKRKYGLEPMAFSFNEPDYGVNVLIAPEQHADYIRRIGAHLESLGLKTKVYVGDNGSPRDPEYIDGALADKEAMRYGAALSFHSWFGAEPDVYRQWSDKANAAGLPLHVAEAGWDAIYQNVSRWLSTYHYAMREMRMYQELLTYARPATTMQWELTSDYSVYDVRPDGQGGRKLEPTERFHFLRHLYNLSPRDSQHVPVTIDRPAALVTALHRPESGDLAIHAANFGAARSATISGIPEGVATLSVVVTTETEKFVSRAPVSVAGGSVTVDLPAHSLVTLTTVAEKSEY